MCSAQREGADAALDRLAREHNEFETDADGGRGQSYRTAQRATSARLVGIEALLRAVTEVYDPIRLAGKSESDAVELLLRYLTAMYGLRPGRDGALLDWLEGNMCYDYAHIPDRADDWCPRLTVHSVDGGAVAELPRLALVASGVRPGCAR
ncbi:hypothetical protein GTY41_17725 [Streptomyces sp. SID685]|uniref:hypothetical protein n=1 Tax=Streptomyces TaxID=1883 RepID=UPI00136A8FBD|nr:hypothetical protein [Streptomyces sp. SID685]MYR86730.1 hypothetical protein [Streptomyces sp. SID685]